MPAASSSTRRSSLLRSADGEDNGVRLLDLDDDGHLDVIGSVESAQFQQHGTHQLLSQLAVALEGDDRERT